MNEWKGREGNGGEGNGGEGKGREGCQRIEQREGMLQSLYSSSSSSSTVYESIWAIARDNVNHLVLLSSYIKDA